MKYTCHHTDKWIFANTDLAEEQLEKSSKALIIIAGASSSGKSFLAASLKKAFEGVGKRCLTFSLDQYNFGLSGIIPNKVNLNYFHSSLENMPEIIERIKKIIINVPFDKKYDWDTLPKIKEEIKDLLSEDKLNVFIPALNEEWKKLNFDEPTVYNLPEAAEDIKLLFDNQAIYAKNYSKITSERMPSDVLWDGKNYDVIIVEGIYALNPNFVTRVASFSPVKNFIEGNPKTLFLRRIIRDKKLTSASSAFTISLYFKYILDSYRKTILPNKSQADIVLENDFSFHELREGDLYTSRDTFPVENIEAIKQLKKDSKIESVSYQKDFYFTVPGEKLENQNLLRFRERSLDGGKTYIPGSLVHKGAPKFRMDNKIIRPINVLLDEDGISHVWSSNDEVIFSFLDNGFEISKAEEKIKTRLNYKGQEFSLYEVRGKQAYLEIVSSPKEDIISEVKNIVK